MKVIFEFSGGSRDGQTDVGPADRIYGKDCAAAQRYWLTDNGTVGKRFMIATEPSMERLRQGGEVRGIGEKYEITDRLEEGDEVLVRCKFIGYA